MESANQLKYYPYSKKWVPWSNERILNEGEKVYDEFKYGTTLAICGYAKTTSSTALISVGVTLIFSGLTHHPMFHEHAELNVILAFVAIAIALIITYIFDKYQKKMKIRQLGLNKEDTNRQIFETAMELKNHHDKEIEAKDQVVEAKAREIAATVADQKIYEALLFELELRNKEGIVGISAEDVDKFTHDVCDEVADEIQSDIEDNIEEQ